ncbi:MAG: aminopeptidase P family protein [Bacteroidota bacterium]
MTTIPDKLHALRSAMQQHQLAAYLIPSSDPHQSEYVAPRWDTRAWLSGFTGSAGTLIVTDSAAGVWTDSRYFIQAEAQLANTGVELQKQRVPHAPEHVEWLANTLQSGDHLGFDGRVVSLSQARMLRSKLQTRGIHLEARYDLPGKIWTDRPGMPKSEIFDFPLTYAGVSREEKLSQIRAWLESQQANAILLTALDDIAWTLNIRASDVDYNPVCISYLIVDREGARWFVGEDRVDESLRRAIAAAGVHIMGYDAIDGALQNYPASQKLAVDPAGISFYHFELLAGKDVKEAGSPVTALKTIKNKTEIKHYRQVMRKDGVALLRLFRWLEAELEQRGVSEVEVSERLAGFRAEQAAYHGESFGAIVGYQGNGAIVHYRAEPDTCATLQAEGILLLDSGGQYMDGTTDITRTVALGQPSEEQKRHFTLVLKGMIALSRAKFPKGTGGAQLDTLARQYLWQDGLNYGHGTGHGVGFFLNVHEGPQGFATSAVTSRGRTAFEPGMVTSNEPGFYRTDHYGIRIENLVLCVAQEKTDYGQFYGFEELTLFPIDQSLMDTSLLTSTEIAWLNTYHQKVWDELSPLLEQEAERKWLQDRCKAIN